MSVAPDQFIKKVTWELLQRRYRSLGTKSGHQPSPGGSMSTGLRSLHCIGDYGMCTDCDEAGGTRPCPTTVCSHLWHRHVTKHLRLPSSAGASSVSEPAPDTRVLCKVCSCPGQTCRCDLLSSGAALLSPERPRQCPAGRARGHQQCPCSV